jgi:hypothetical protein
MSFLVEVGGAALRTMTQAAANHPGATAPSGLFQMRWAALVAGLRADSLAAIVGALVVCAGWIAFAAWKVTPGWVAAHSALLTTGIHDELPELGSKTLALALSPPSGRMIVLVGDSSLREAVTTESDLASCMAKEIGHPEPTVMLTAGGLTIFDEVAVLDQLSGRIHGAVVVEISEFQLSMSPATVRETPEAFVHSLPFVSDACREELTKAGVALPPLLHNYFFDNYPFFAARIDSLVRFRPAYRVQPHFLDEHAPWTMHEWRSRPAAVRLRGWEATYRQSRDVNFGIYARMLGRLRMAGLQPCLLRMVENPQTELLCKGPELRLRQEYAEDVRRFAKSQGVPLIEDLEKIAELRPKDFTDYVHLRTNAARVRYTACLARCVAEALNGRTDFQVKVGRRGHRQ